MRIEKTEKSKKPKRTRPRKFVVGSWDDLFWRIASVLKEHESYCLDNSTERDILTLAMYDSVANYICLFRGPRREDDK